MNIKVILTVLLTPAFAGRAPTICVTTRGDTAATVFCWVCWLAGAFGRTFRIWTPGIIEVWTIFWFVPCEIYFVHIIRWAQTESKNVDYMLKQLQVVWFSNLNLKGLCWFGSKRNECLYLSIQNLIYYILLYWKIGLIRKKCGIITVVYNNHIIARCSQWIFYFFLFFKLYGRWCKNHITKLLAK